MAHNKDVKYIEQLTWLRGIAAFLVIVSHSIRATEDAYVPGDGKLTSSVLSLLDLGDIGVLLFFVLSGCTLYISNAHRMTAGNISGFYIKRVFRIWPAFLVSLIAYILFGMLFASLYPEPSGNWIERQFLAPYDGGDVMSYVFMLFNLIGPWGLFNNAYWSLPVEFQYYLIFPLLVLLSRRTTFIGPVLVGAALYLVPRTGLFDLVNYKVFSLAFTFCNGVGIGWLYINARHHRFSTFQGSSMLLAILLFTSAIRNGVIPVPDLPVLAEHYNWFGVMAVLSVYIMLMTEFNLHNRIERFLRYYGTISYSTYLYHNIFISISVLLLIELGVHEVGPRLWFTFMFTLCNTLLVAGLSFRYIEQPFIGIGRRIATPTQVGLNHEGR